jgi:nucleoside-diphosphate-sugar epimerase
MRYCVTGATGFVGGEVTRQLRAAGHSVTALVRDPARAAALRALGVELQPGDITDRDALRRAMAGVDGVFHIAGWYKVGARDTRDAEAVNIEGTRNVLAVMRELQVPKGVYTSSIIVHSDTRGRLVDETYRFSGEHLSVYARTKAAAHALAEQAGRDGLPLVTVQPAVVYGPGDTSSVRTTMHQLLRGRLPVMPAGTVFSWVHIEDAARGHLQAMEHGRPGESYILTGSAHGFDEVIRLAAATAGVAVPRLTAPAGLLRAAARLVGVIERILPLQLPETYTAEGLRMTSGVTYIADGSKAERELGFRARPFAEGMRATIEHELRALGR